ncbi:hypothetical protein ACFWNT_46300, partial [Streptomyces sp. NPDC058409]|uniref:hypothetical protein n=1 Tax=Streptomyces sp. NPDC058409 TaxID=3346484 RepID=UPI003648833C
MTEHQSAHARRHPALARLRPGLGLGTPLAVVGSRHSAGEGWRREWFIMAAQVPQADRLLMGPVRILAGCTR